METKLQKKEGNKKIKKSGTNPTVNDEEMNNKDKTLSSLLEKEGRDACPKSDTIQR